MARMFNRIDCLMVVVFVIVLGVYDFADISTST